MEITGYDTVLVSFRVRPAHLRAFVERLAAEWPALLASNSADKGAGYAPWRDGVPLDEPAGELYLVRDREMEALQAEEGYAETPDGASPVAVFYKPAPAEALDIRLLEEFPGENGDMYPARLVGREIFFVTLVTAADPAEGGFAKRVLDLLTESLTAT